MNKSECTTILSSIVISSLLATAFVFVGSMNLSQKAAGQAEDVFGENATFTEEVEGTGATTNQTAPTTNQTAPTTNQTAPTTNLTSSDIEPVRDSLNTARIGLQDNDAQAALEALNNADGALFAIINEEPKGPVSDQLSTLQGNIDTARESLHGNDNAKALQDLNAADSHVLVITEMLPAEEAVEGEEGEEGEEAVEGEEGEEEPEEE
jgi:hypothetical protein